MPRDGSGVYTLPAGNPVVTNTIITSAWANGTMSDIAAQLNNVLTRDGLLGPTGPFKLQDGTVAAPGLAWASEAGLGFYRKSASLVTMAAQGATTFYFDAGAAASSNLFIFPRTPGGSIIGLRSAPLGAANYNQLGLFQNAGGDSAISTAAVGTATRGNLTLDAPQVLYNDGTVAAPNIAFASEPGLGWYREGAGSMNLATQGGVSVGFSFNSPTSVSLALYPRTAAATNTLFLFGSPKGAANYNALSLSQQPGGGAFLSTFVAGTATRGNLTLDAPLVAHTGGVVANNVNGIGIGPGGTTNTTWRILQEGTVIRQYFNNNVNSRFDYDIATGIFSITTSGGAYNFNNDGNNPTKNVAGPWNATVSDVRAKRDVEDYTEGLAAVLALRPRSFHYTDEVGIGGKQLGFIEQETRGILPSVPSALADKLGIPDLKTNDQTPVSYMLINAIKELHERLDHLETVH